MTSKERAKLKSIASNEETIIQIGKNPLSSAFVKQVKDALAARELVKIKVLETCEMLPAEFAQAIAEETSCEIVQVIGSKAVLFKRRPKTDKKPSLLDEQPKDSKSASTKSNDKKPPKTLYNQKKQDGKSHKSKAYGNQKSFAPKPYQPKESRIRSVQKNKKKQG